MTKSPDAFRTISEVADWLGTPAHVLRFWESKFSQVKPVKRAGGRRYYRPKDMELLGGLKKLLHEDGMTIKGAQALLREKGVKHVAAMSQPLDDGAPVEADSADGEPVADAAIVVDQTPDAGDAAAASDPAPAPIERPAELAQSPEAEFSQVPDADDVPEIPLDPDADIGDDEPPQDPAEALPFLHRPQTPKPEEPFLRAASKTLDEASEAPKAEEAAPQSKEPIGVGAVKLDDLRTALNAPGGFDPDVLATAASRLKSLRDRMASPSAR